MNLFCIRLLLSLLPIITAFTIGTPVLCGGDWPQWRGPNRNAIADESGLLRQWIRTPPVAWKATGIGTGYSSIVISNGQVFVTGAKDGQVICTSLDIATGKTQWSRVVGKTSRNVMATPSVDQHRVFILDPDGDLIGLDRRDGHKIWERSFLSEFGGKLMSGRGYGESPLVDGNRLICTPGGDQAMIVALESKSGATIWKTPFPKIGPKGRTGAAFSSIAVANAAGLRQFVQLTGRGLVGIEATSGRYLWGYNDITNTTANIPTPIVHKDLVFAANGYHAGSVLLRIVKSENGTGVAAEEVYRLKGNRFQNHHGGFVRIGDHVFGGHGSNNGLPTCLEFETGKIAWKRRGPGSGSASVVAADGHLVFHYQDGLIALIEANSDEFRLKGTFQLPEAAADSWAHPVIARKKLFLREHDNLWAFDIADRGNGQTAPTDIPPQFLPLKQLGVGIRFLSNSARGPDRLMAFPFASGRKTLPLAVISLENKHLAENGAIIPAIDRVLQSISESFAMDLSGTRCSQATLMQLEKITKAVALSIELCPEINDDSLAALKAARQLKAISASGTSISTTGLQALAALPNLESLNLEYCDSVDDSSCAALANLVSLRALSIRKTAFEKNKVSNIGLRQLAKLNRLEFLDLSANAIDNESMKLMTNFERLKSLSLDRTSVTDVGLVHLAELQSLEELRLVYSEGFAGPTITDRGILAIAKLGRLKVLDLTGAKISDDSISALSRLKQLKQVKLTGTRISAPAVRLLKQAKPGLDVR